jgi:hypothetical protein
MPESHHTLPILAKFCDRIDELFIEQVGPFGQLLILESRQTWCTSGAHVKPSDVRQYIALLAREIPELDKRQTFVAKADALLHPG